MSEFATLQEIVLAAKRKMPPALWDFVAGGSESETTLRRNRHALDSLAFCPRVLRDVARIDTATTLLGHGLALPLVMAPVGSVALVEPGGALTVARAAARCGVLTMVSAHAEPGLEAVAAGAGGPLVLTLYVRGDLARVDDQVDRAKAAGCRAIALVTDAPYYARRERDLMNRFVSPSSRSVPYARLQHLMRQGRALPEGPETVNTGMDGARLTWETVDRIKARAGLPLVLKGIVTAKDATLAVEHGVDALYVSNHGGRQLDHGRATMDVLPEILAAVAGRAEVIVDGGFLRGSDILKAVATGARAVGLGKLQCWALAAAGEEGLVRALEILEEELIVDMGLLGVTALDQLDPDYLCPVQPLGPAHPLSSFPAVLAHGGSGAS
ncbi:MAG: alpha-hydroxy acid oxidase [Candidatus Rokuibacteriota bacterium]